MSIGIRWLSALFFCFVLECAIGVLVVAAHYMPRPQLPASSPLRCLMAGQSLGSANIAGKVVQCDQGLCDGGGAEVLAYGLEDPRGLAYDNARNRVLIADGERSDLISYDVARRAYVQDDSFPCPDGPCEAVDLRGIAMWRGNTYLAEHDRARIALQRAGSVVDFPDDDAPFAGPSGVTIDKRNSIVFVTDDRPWPASAAAPTPYDVSDYTRWLDQNRPRMFGAAYALPVVGGGKVDSTSVDVFGKDLRHPSGIAISTGGTLYVTEADQYSTRWVKFKRGPDCRWARSGVLAAAKSLGGSIPAFQGIAINQDGTHIYAAGPGGLYVFRADGTALGRVEFDGPVTGLAWGSCGDGGQSCLYLAVAHSLCRLHTSDTAPAPDQEGAAALPSCQATVNRPPSVTPQRP